MEKSTVFIAGGTGYIGKRLIGILLREGYDVIALVREQSIKKLPMDVKLLLVVHSIVSHISIQYRRIVFSFTWWA